MPDPQPPPPSPAPAFLLLPGPADPHLPRILRKVRLLALRALLGLDPAGLDGQMGAALRTVQGVLAGVARSRGAPLLEAVGDPDVLPLLLCLHRGLISPDRALAGAVPPLLLRLSASGLLPEAVLWGCPIRSLSDRGRGRQWEFSPPAVGLLAHQTGAELRLDSGAVVTLDCADDEATSHGGVEIQRPFVPVAEGLHLSLSDANPLAHVEAHPDKAGNQISLGGRTASVWVDALSDALAMVRAALPGWAAELPVALQRLVPVGFEPQRHLSASYREAPGLAYLTLHPDPLTMAEALIHETQHGRLNALCLLDPVLRNGHTTWTPSPVRPDLRPLMGVLLAVHAFVPVAVMHARLADADHPVSRTAAFSERRAQVLAGNERGIAACLSKAEPTPVGARLLADLQRVHAWCVDRSDAPVEATDAALPG